MEGKAYVRKLAAAFAALAHTLASAEHRTDMKYMHEMSFNRQNLAVWARLAVLIHNFLLIINFR